MKFLEKVKETGVLPIFYLKTEVEEMMEQGITEKPSSKILFSPKKRKQVLEIMDDINQNHNTSWYRELRNRAEKDFDAVAIFYRGRYITFREMFEQVDINNSNEKDNKPPVIVHCSAGAGRTGTFIAMYLIEKEIMKQIEDKCPIIRINIFNLVRKLKEMRIYMVQTTLQYLYIYSFAEKVLKEENR